MLESFADPTIEKISYAEKLAKLREGFADNSDLQSTTLNISNIPNIVKIEPVREYVSQFGTVVECHPSKFSPSVEKPSDVMLLCTTLKPNR